MFELGHKLSGVAMITGAGSGIGRGVAMSFADSGCKKIFLGDINIPGLEETAQSIENRHPEADVQICRVDIASRTSVDKFVGSCVQHFGRIDYANNIAGVVPQRVRIPDVDVTTLDRVIEINLIGTWLCHRAQIAQMMRQAPLSGYGNVRGSIVSVSSLSGLNASPGMSAYCASKHGLVGICKTDALDYGKHGIRINCVCPGMIDTLLFRQTSTPEMLEKMADVTPIRRLGAPEDVGNVMVWLSGAQSSFITGVVIPVDGGLCLHRP